MSKASLAKAGQTSAESPGGRNKEAEIYLTDQPRFIHGGEPELRLRSTRNIVVFAILKINVSIANHETCI